MPSGLRELCRPLTCPARLQYDGTSPQYKGEQDTTVVLHGLCIAPNNFYASLCRRALGLRDIRVERESSDATAKVKTKLA